MLTIASIDSVNSSVLPYVYRSVSQAKDPIRLRIITQQSEGVYDLVENKKADIGFISVPCRRADVVTSFSFTQKFYVVKYCEFPSLPKQISPEDLNTKFEIFQNWGGNYQEWHQSIWGNQNEYFAWIDTVALLQYFLTDEKF